MPATRTESNPALHLGGVRESYPKILNSPQHRSSLEHCQWERLSTSSDWLSRTAHRLQAWLLGESEESSPLEVKEGMEGVCFLLEIFPKSGTTGIKGWQFCLPQLVWKLSPAHPQLSSQVLRVLTFHLPHKKLFDTALLGAGLSLCRGKRPQFNCVQTRLFFPPLNFHFCYWNKTTKKNQLYAQPKLANVNNFSVLIGRGQTGRLHTYTHTGKAESFNLILPSRACNKCSQDLFLFPFVFIKLWRVSFPFSFLSGALPILYYGSYKTWSTLFSLFFFFFPSLSF